MKKMIVGLGVDLPAVIGKNGVIKEEVINSIVRQIKNLRLAGGNVFVFAFQASKYCHLDNITGENLKAVFGKARIAEIFSKAFDKRHLRMCTLESSMHIGQTMNEALCSGVVPVLSGHPNCSCLKVVDLLNCTADDVYFSYLCKVVNAGCAVFISGKYECKRKRELYPLLLEKHVLHRVSMHYQADFLLNSLQGLEV